MLATISTALADVVFVVALMALAAVVSEVLDWLVKLVISIFATPIGAVVVEGYLTYPGVVYHELSHALFAFVSGAKVTGISLKRQATEGGFVLGSVTFVPRGPAPLQSLQKTLAGIAPVVTGMAGMALMYLEVFPCCTAVWHWVLAGYLFLCLLLHTDLSFMDLMQILSGLPLVLVILFVVFLVVPFDPSAAVDWIIGIFQ